MNILIIHEIDWIKKIPFEPHHLAELLSLKGNNIYVVDCPEPNLFHLFNGFSTTVLTKFHRLYDNAEITIIRPPSILVKGLNRISHFLTCKKILKKIIQEKNIDIILLYGVATNGLQTCQLSREFEIPVVFRLLDIAHGLVKIPFLDKIIKNLEKQVFKNSSKTFTTTEHLSKYAVSMGSSLENTEKFLYGVNTKIFFPMSKDLSLLHKLKFSDNDKILVFMGTIYNFAGLDYFISKFYLIEKQFSNVKFLIVGDGPYKKTLEKIILKHNLESKIHITGFVDQKEIPNYLSLADICINTFDINDVTKRIIPTKILEYLACGKPVITTPLLGIKEFFPSEDFGVSYSTPELFHQSVIDLLLNKQKMDKMAQDGSNYVKNTLDWELITDSLLEKFRTIIKENKINN